MKEMKRLKLWYTLLVIAMLAVLIGCSNGNGELSSSTVIPSSAATASEIPTMPTEESVQEPDIEPSATAAPSPDAAEPTKDDSEDEAPPSPQPPSSAAKPSTKPTAKPEAEAEPAPEAPISDQITISIVGNAEWGTVLAEEAIDLSEADTPAEVLIRAAKAHRLSYEIRGSGALTYIEGIDGLYEFDDGPTSGWKFRVNGQIASIGAGVYELKPGDRLEWFYGYEDSESADDKESAT